MQEPFEKWTRNIPLIQEDMIKIYFRFMSLEISLELPAALAVSLALLINRL